MPLTILWVVAIANAVNLVDGLDGLAAGMIAIAAAAFFVYMIRTPSTFGDASAAALLSAITVGMCLGFLPWNFYPAKIFMGDSGSLLLGMLLAIATIDGVGRNPFEPSGGDIAADRPACCWCRCSCCSSRSSTSCSRSRGAPGAGRASGTPTRSTSIIG